MVPIDGFDKNVRIVHVGDLFKKIGTKDWKINVFGSPIQDKKYTRFANLPLLSRDKIINATTPEGAFPFMCWRILSFRQITTILHHCAVALLLGTTLNNFSDTQFQRHEIEPSNPASG